jgi:ERCC4-related helicase
VVCVILDEAHHATGEHAYVKCIRAISQHSERFRVVALTAQAWDTPQVSTLL